MTLVIIYTIISFLLDGLMANFTNFSLTNLSYFTTIYSVIALVIIYNYFNNDQKYLKILIILGILFDIVYTNTFILNIFIFLIIYFVLKSINTYLPNNLFVINIKALLAIIIYHTLSFVILSLANYSNYSIKLYLSVLSHNLIMTIIYTSISYLIIKKYIIKSIIKR